MSQAQEAISIRDIETLSDMRSVEVLQREIWGVADLEVFPALAFLPLKEVGAILIGAFSGTRLVGFVFGFPGFSNGQRIIHSDMLGVIEEYRSLSLGYLLKLAQRERAIEMRIDTITWTFDPLQSRNAHLNFARLGVTADRYAVDFYGQTTSHLHSLGTDRLWVRWQLNSDRVKDRINRVSGSVYSHDWGHALVQVSSTLEPIASGMIAGDAHIAIEIPSDLSHVESSLARHWRETTRLAFQNALDSGYVVEDYAVYKKDDRRIGSYRLSKRNERG